MHDTNLPDFDQLRLLATLPPDERQLAESLLKAAPTYTYNRSGLPKLDPPPAAGAASAAAAAKAMMAWIRSRRLD
jgi:hypothetical protein